MSFYSSIAKFYNYIFPLNSAQVNFVKSHTPMFKHKNLLEIGSATGNLTLALKQEGYSAFGLELDERMNDIAKSKLQVNTSMFTCANMLNIDNVYIENTFNSIVCFGNTLVHLQSGAEVKEFIEKSYSLLNDGGKLLIQIINYDRVIDNSVDSLPTIENEKVKFVRNYLLKSEYELLFNTSLTIKEDNKTITNSQKLMPIRRETINKIISSAGFNTIESFGAFDGSDWSNESMNTIVVCTK